MRERVPEEVVAVIVGAITAYLGKVPEKYTIVPLGPMREGKMGPAWSTIGRLKVMAGRESILGRRRGN